MDSAHSRMPCASSGIGMLLTKSNLGYLGPYWSISIWSRFFFPLYGSLKSCLHYLKTEASKWLKTGKRNGFLGACGWFHFCRTSWLLDNLWLERTVLKLSSLEYTLANCSHSVATLGPGSFSWIWTKNVTETPLSNYQLRFDWFSFECIWQVMNEVGYFDKGAYFKKWSDGYRRFFTTSPRLHPECLLCRVLIHRLTLQW